MERTIDDRAGKPDWEHSTDIRMFVVGGADRILIADGNRARSTWLRAAIGDDLRVEHRDHTRSVLEALSCDPPRVLVVGSDLVDASGEMLLSFAASHGLIAAGRGPVVFLMGDHAHAMRVDESVVPIYYRLSPTLQPQRVRELFLQASSRHAARAPSPVEDPVRARHLADHARRFCMQTERAGAAAGAAAAVVEVCRADRARVLYFDDDSGALWSETEGASDRHASAGLAGLVARTCLPIVLDRAGDDPAYCAVLDDPTGTGAERLAIQPVLDRDCRLQAVIIAVRDPASPAFEATDLRLLQDVASTWGLFVPPLGVEPQTGGDVRERRATTTYWIVLVAVLATAMFAYSCSR